MTVVIFIGPTIPEADVLSIIDAVCLPPAAQGDVYRAMALEPQCIGIIDGYFNGVAAIWHKEILWALAQGVHVFGASSIGALRAAELAEFGMKGVGRIYEDYRCGKLEDDDEVAIIHGPAELGFIPLCEPMVNIRATLEFAVGENILTEIDRQALCEFAKSRLYSERTWEALIAFAGAHVLDAPNAQKFETWLQNSRVDQKHIDAVAMLEAMRETVKTDREPHTALFDFEWTNLWDRAVSQWHGTPHTGINTRFILDELRLQPDNFNAARDAALLREFAVQDSVRQHLSIESHVHASKVNTFRRQQNLLKREDLDRWLQQNDLSARELEDLLDEEIRIRSILDTRPRSFTHSVLKILKLNGDYSSLSQRAGSKDRMLKKSGRSNLRPEDIGVPQIALLNWYFCHRMGQEMPAEIDTHISDIGLESREEFYQMLVREYLYVQCVADN